MPALMAIRILGQGCAACHAAAQRQKSCQQSVWPGGGVGLGKQRRACCWWAATGDRALPPLAELGRTTPGGS